MRKLRLTFMILLAPAILASAYLASAIQKATPTTDGTTTNALRYYGGFSTGKQPIFGDKLSRFEARSRMGIPIPRLPAATVDDPCRPGSQVVLAEDQAWASEVAVPNKSRRVAIYYRPGIWIWTTPVSELSPGVVKGTELRPIEEVGLLPASVRAAIKTGTVRGHVATINEFEGSPTCHEDGVSAGDPTLAIVSWLEAGKEIKLVGALPSSKLIQLAEEITFE